MTETASGSLTTQPPPKKFSRKLFFPVALACLVGGSIAAYQNREAIANALEELITGAKDVQYRLATSSRLKPSDAPVDPAIREIGALIDSALREVYDRKRSTEVYRAAYEALGQSAAKANAAYENLNPRHPNAREYRALEINARMWQAYLLITLTAANIILPGEGIDIKDIGSLASGARLGASFRKFNSLKALENYENVERLLDEAKALNIELPSYVSVRLYGSSEGVAGYRLVYQRMLKTINALLADQDLSAQYKPVLNAKKDVIERKLLQTQ